MCGGSPYPLNSVLILFSEEVFLSQAEGGVDADAGGRRQLQSGECTAVSCWDTAALFNTTVPGTEIVPGTDTKPKPKPSPDPNPNLNLNPHPNPNPNSNPNPTPNQATPP